jgi:hypothetical protein
MQTVPCIRKDAAVVPGRRWWVLEAEVVEDGSKAKRVRNKSRV